ncbi:arginine--tRNA ligase [Candidatus Dojkabacteria bacterium]|nr:arginine--tRNA ligase [Candidatus Dojkabacteria bacterium]
MDVKTQIKNQIQETLKEKFDYEIGVDEIRLERPQNEEHGDWSSNIAMQLTKELKKSPKEIAEKIIEELDLEGEIEVSIAEPGFINFKLPGRIYTENLGKILEEKELYGNNTRLSGKRIMVEFAHPNPFKSFHIGHLRNIILGESIVRMLESQNADVIRVNYQGDVGMHIAKNLWAFMDIDPKDYPKTADEKTKLLGELYAKGATAFEEDEKARAEIKEINRKIYTKEDPGINQLWELGKTWSLEKFHEIYERVYTTFEREYFESETLDLIDKPIEKAKEKRILKESDGALIFNGEEYGLDIRVFVNSQGLPTYEGKELGLAVLKNREYGIVDLHIHNVAVEQKSFFAVTFKVKELLWPEEFKNRQYHNAYEFVGLKKGKMSSRKGNVVLGNDILNIAHERIGEIIKDREEIDGKEETAEIVGVGAIKWSFLKISPFKYLAFDLEESVNFEGDSGPYIQYTYARAASILREGGNNEKAGKVEFDAAKYTQKLSAEEEKLLKWLERFPEVVEAASKEYMPNYIATYLFELSQKFNSFYKNNIVLKENEKEIRNFRLALVKATSLVLKRGLDLMGIKTVEKM